MTNWDVEKDGSPDGFETFKDMFLVYNLIMHAPILPINFLIIFKEIQLEKLQLMSNWTDSEYADKNLSLGYGDARRSLDDFFWFLNPFSYMDLAFAFFFGFPPRDIIKEDPDDEEHYYKNWV